jgi:hypothetical protein
MNGNMKIKSKLGLNQMLQKLCLKKKKLFSYMKNLLKKIQGKLAFKFKIKRIY